MENIVNEQVESPELVGKASAEQIAQWKKEYGQIFEITADNKVCYLRKPSRQILGYAMTQYKQPLKMTETLLNNCFIGGCEDFKTDDDLFMGINLRIEELISVKQVELAKL